MELCVAINEIDWTVTKDVMSIIGSAATVVGVGAASWIGLSGLKSWRAQFRSTADHELARRLLIEVYRFSDIMRSARDISLGISDLDRESLRALDVSGNQPRYAFSLAIYTRRNERLSESLSTIKALFVEVRIIWGDLCRVELEELSALKDEWWGVARRYVAALNPDEDPETAENYATEWIKKKGVLYDQVDSDKFRDSLDNTIKKIESQLKNKLV